VLSAPDASPGLFPAYIRPQVHDPRCLPAPYNIEHDRVIQPIVTATILVLGGYGNRVLLRCKPTLKSEFDVQQIPLREHTKVYFLDSSIGAVYIDSNAIAHENAYCRRRLRPMKPARDLYLEAVAG
jgi:hypothetical protein